MAELDKAISPATLEMAQYIATLFQEPYVRTVTIHERPVEKMCRPCDGCHSYKLCAEDGYECSHFKMWVDKGKYNPEHSTWK